MKNAPQQTRFLIEVSDARVRVGRRRVLCVDRLRIEPGQHWCLFGGNGSGKSLLAALLRGELVGGRQHVTYGQGFEPARDCVTVSFEEQQRLWTLDNRHDISEFDARAQDAGTTVARLTGLHPDAPTDDWRRHVVETLGLAELLSRGIRFLSSGQMRKVLLARAVLGAPDRGPGMLILDDPLETIDREDRARIQALLVAWMSPKNCLLLLCRRRSEMLPGMTHLALMQDLTLRAHGATPKMLAQLDAAGSAAPSGATGPVDIPPDHRKPAVVSSDEPLIRLDGVSAGYGETPVLERVSWTFARGQHCVVEGPNGCGKSTLLSLISGENHKAYGQAVYLFGRRRGSGESVWDVKLLFGIVSNEIHNRYLRGWRVLDVVLSGFFDSVGLYDDSGASQADAGRAWLRGLGIDGLAARNFHEISFGEQRVVLLARAMVKRPRILILDEPCVGLDDYFRARVLQIVDRIAECTVTQIVYVTHTAGEEPGCINQRLRFVPDDAGGYRLTIENSKR